MFDIVLHQAGISPSVGHAMRLHANSRARLLPHVITANAEQASLKQGIEIPIAPPRFSLDDARLRAVARAAEAAIVDQPDFLPRSPHTIRDCIAMSLKEIISRHR